MLLRLQELGKNIGFTSTTEFATVSYSHSLPYHREMCVCVQYFREEMAATIVQQQQSGGIILTGLTELRRYAKRAEEEMSKGKYSNDFTSMRHYVT